MREGDIDRAPPNIFLAGGKADDKILVLAGWLAVLEWKPDNLVAGARATIPGPVHGDKGTAFIFRWKRCPVVESNAKRRGMGLHKHVTDRDPIFQI